MAGRGRGRRGGRPTTSAAETAPRSRGLRSRPPARNRKWKLNARGERAANSKRTGAAATIRGMRRECRGAKPNATIRRYRKGQATVTDTKRSVDAARDSSGKWDGPPSPGSRYETRSGRGSTPGARLSEASTARPPRDATPISPPRRRATSGSRPHGGGRAASCGRPRRTRARGRDRRGARCCSRLRGESGSSAH